MPDYSFKRTAAALRRHTCAVLLALTLVATQASAQTAPRAAQPMFKGVELYSWKDPASQAWVYSLLPGTNRNKALFEITDARVRISDERALEAKLGALAKGEYVSWYCSYPELSLPPASVVNEIVNFASAHDLHLFVSK